MPGPPTQAFARFPMFTSDCGRACVRRRVSDNRVRTLSIPHAFQFQSQRSLNMLVSARGLDRRHGGTKLLDDVSFGIEAGERISVVGPTGSGKSLLLRSIAILEPFDAGQVLWNGNPVSSHDACRYRSSEQNTEPGALTKDHSVITHPNQKRLSVGPELRGASCRAFCIASSAARSSPTVLQMDASNL